MQTKLATVTKCETCGCGAVLNRSISSVGSSVDERLTFQCGYALSYTQGGNIREEAPCRESDKYRSSVETAVNLKNELYHIAREKGLSEPGLRHLQNSLARLEHYV